MAVEGRATIARHAVLRSPGPVRQALRGFAVAATVLLVSALGVGAYAAWDFARAWGDEQIALPVDGPAVDLAARDEAFTLLLVGSDECEDEYAHYFPGRCDADAASALNDVNILVHVSEQPRRVTAVTFPRDLLTPVPACAGGDGSELSPMASAQINALYARGGVPCIARTITEISGQQVDFAMAVTWGGVIEITDAIGGVEVCVGGDGIYDPDNTGLALAPGLHTLQGIWALEFLRTREGVGDGSDLARVSNQQLFMTALAQKMTSEGVVSDPVRVLSLARTIVGSVTPSENLADVTTLAQLGLALAEVPLDDVTFVRLPTFPAPTNANRVVLDEEKADALWQALDANTPFDVAQDDVTGTIEAPPDATVEPAPSPAPTTAAPAANTEETASGAQTGTRASESLCANGRG